LGERGFKNGNMIQHGVYHKNTRIFYRGKIVSSSYVQDCRRIRSDLSETWSECYSKCYCFIVKVFFLNMLMRTIY
jgi:hypothetical protein